MAECALGGYWPGQVCSSPVATAAAVSALVMSHRQDSDDVLRESAAGDGQVIQQLVQGDLSELLFESVHWLAKRQNRDGGWSDCEGAPSNIAATMQVQAAFRLTGIPAKYADLMVRADQFVAVQGGITGLRRQVGKSKSYLAPILACCAEADMIPWRNVPTLPFEWLALPQRWRQEIHLPVSRYAAPIVLAVGLAKLHNDPPRNPVTRLLRRSLRAKALAALARFQAADDSFLASPLVTAYVVMGLASMGCQEHAVVARGVEYLLSCVRSDASWAVAANRTTMNTTLALDGLGSVNWASARDDWFELHDVDERQAASHWQDTATTNDTVPDLPTITAASAAALSDSGSHPVQATLGVTEQSIEWLLRTQQPGQSALSDAPAGGWGTSDATGAEPNTVATGRALAALAAAYRPQIAIRARIDRAAMMGASWLLEMQNEDGGWPTYCREDDAEPMDGSGVDPTAEALRALAMWQRIWKCGPHRHPHASQTALCARIGQALERGTSYLETQQQEDGSFIPLWFGNEHQARHENPVMGTAQVLAACAELGCLDSNLAKRAAAWMLSTQHASGGWGPPRSPVDYSDNERDSNFRSWRENEALSKFCSVEETAAAVSALIPLTVQSPALERGVSRGLTWLTNAVEQDLHRQPAVVGYYLARIWYYERLYPLAFAAGALSRAMSALTPAVPATSTAP